ncbi:hypothetical protein M8C21_005173, partial [Ambrosia artemisiifolia]
MGVVFGPINDKNCLGLLEDFIEKAGGCAVIDGGFATQLELHGASIKDPLWSALCLINNPHLISKVHLGYLEAGVDIIVTYSYQATLPGFILRGLSLEQGEKLLEKSVKLAMDARDVFCETAKKIDGHDEHEKTLDGFLDFLVVSLAVALRKKPTTPVTNRAAAISSEKGKRKKHCHGSSNPAAAAAAANSSEKGKLKKHCHGSSNPTEAATNSSEKGLVWHNHED